MKHFKAAAQRATAFVLAASMMSSAVLPTVFAAQPWQKGDAPFATIRMPRGLLGPVHSS